MKFFNGNLLVISRQLAYIAAMQRSDFLNISSAYFPINTLANLVVEGRKIGLEWLWEDEYLRKDEGVWRWPSVDLHGVGLSFEGHDNLRLHLEKAHGIVFPNCAWDTEYSAWYPAFMTKGGALQARKKLNNLFDKKILPIVESYL